LVIRIAIGEPVLFA